MEHINHRFHSCKEALGFFPSIPKSPSINKSLQCYECPSFYIYFAVCSFIPWHWRPADPEADVGEVGSWNSKSGHLCNRRSQEFCPETQVKGSLQKRSDQSCKVHKCMDYHRFVILLWLCRFMDLLGIKNCRCPDPFQRTLMIILFENFELVISVNLYSYQIFSWGLPFYVHLWRQCGPVVRALALRSRDLRFKTRSDHSLNLILVVPSSTSQPHL